MAKKKILALSGSLRANSSNEQILQFIASKYSDVLEVEIYNKIDQLPHFNPDLDKDFPPEIVKEFRDKIESSDGVIICTPEYVFSLPGALKNAIEWNVSTTVFSNKPVALIVAAASGQKALEALDLIMTTIECKIPQSAKLLIQGGKGKVGINGKITDQDILEGLDQLVIGLIKSI